MALRIKICVNPLQAIWSNRRLHKLNKSRLKSNRDQKHLRKENRLLIKSQINWKARLTFQIRIHRLTFQRYLQTSWKSIKKLTTKCRWVIIKCQTRWEFQATKTWFRTKCFKCSNKCSFKPLNSRQTLIWPKSSPAWIWPKSSPKLLRTKDKFSQRQSNNSKIWGLWMVKWATTICSMRCNKTSPRSTLSSKRIARSPLATWVGWISRTWLSNSTVTRITS